MDKYIEKLNNLTDKKYKYLRVNSVEIKMEDGEMLINLLVPQYIYDFNFSDVEKKEINDATAKIIPYPFKFKISYKKSYPDETFILRDTLEFIDKKFPALNVSIKENNVDISIKDEIVYIHFKLEQTAHTYMISSGAEDRLIELLSHNYCNDFLFKYTLIEDNIFEEEENAQEAISTNTQYHKAEIGAKLIGKVITGKVKYLRLINGDSGRIIVGGSIKSMFKNHKKDNADNVYYSFILDDKTGSIKALYFPKIYVKDNEPITEKMQEEYKKKLMVMDQLVNDSANNNYDVVCEGNVKLSNNGELTMFINSISKCRIDYNAIVPLIQKKPIPAVYTKVFPTPYIDTIDSSHIIPAYFKNKRIVAFDFETTGINPETDAPIELGAVLIDNGIIIEQFSTYINPRRDIPPEITRLTQISNTDVINAPYIEEIIPDFYKFADNSILVGYNTEFDYAFLKNAAHKDGYIFDQERQDALSLSRRYLRQLDNHKLESVCSYLGIVNEGAHRAIYDAIATARVYIKLLSRI